MVKCYATANSLSSLLDTRSNIEIMAEPYRLQSNVVLCVAYSEYINYVRSLSEADSVQLFSGRTKTVKYAAEKDSRLYNSYLCDVSFAICKEILYSERTREDATVILPVSDKMTQMDVSQFAKSAALMPELTKMAFDKQLELHEHAQVIKSERNKVLKAVASVMFAMSLKGTVAGELSLAYDLQ